MKAANETEVERRHRAHRSRKLMLGNCVLSEKASRRRSDWKFSIELLRDREVEALISERHGSFIPDPGDTDDRDTCLGYIRVIAFSRVQDVRSWCAKWAPWADKEALLPILAEAGRRTRMMRADGVAGLLLVTMAERSKLGLRTIGACDVTKADRQNWALDKKRERDRDRLRKKRKPTTGKDRASYEAESLSSSKPWEGQGISRRTWYRRGGTSASQVEVYTNGDIPVPMAANRPASLPNSSGEAGRWGLGAESPAEVREAEPHGNGDKEAAA